MATHSEGNGSGNNGSPDYKAEMKKAAVRAATGAVVFIGVSAIFGPAIGAFVAATVSGGDGGG